MSAEGTAARWEVLFDELVELGEQERRARLDALRCEDAQLAGFVAALLDADAAPTSGEPRALLARVAALAAEELAAPARPPVEERIGPYRILRPLGSGGMGEVFLAERADGEFEQRVAIKRIRADVGGRHFLERFRRERQILAALEHPGIARLLDGGRTADGHPYIVLELVDGEPITEWCRRTAATLETRVALMRDAARAVDAAHRRLVVHRDLKPSNLLVTADGRPKLLDFGIAKMLAPDDREREGGADTQLFGGPMTPTYAAPEQILGDPVTTATDVFSLGALLYELLAGRPPYARRGRSLSELAREIDAETFTRPSIVAREQTDPCILRIQPRIPDDLETVVAKALHRDPARRYASAAALADDLDRFLTARPVSARPDSLGYRTRKLLRRHRIAVAVGAASLAILVATLVGFGVRLAAERDRARQQALRAEAARRDAERVTEFLVGLFGDANPSTTGVRDPSAREILDRGSKRMANELAGDAVARVHLEEAVARAYLGLFRPADALPHIAAARRAMAGGPLVGNRIVQAQLDFDEAQALIQNRQLVAGEQLARRAIATAEPAGPSGAQLAGWIRNTLAGALISEGRHQEAEAVLREALAVLAPLGEDSRRVLTVRINLALVLQRLGRLDDAAGMLETLLRRIDGRDDRLTYRITIGNILGSLYRAKGDLVGAETWFHDALAAGERLGGPRSPYLIESLIALGFVAQKRDDLPAALSFCQRAEEIATAGKVDNDKALECVAGILRQSGRLDDAAAVDERLLARRLQADGPSSVGVAWAYYDLGEVERDRGRRAAARARFTSALAAFEASVGATHHWTSWPLHELGLLALAEGDAKGAEALLARALTLREKGLAAGRKEIADTREALERARRTPSR